MAPLRILCSTRIEFDPRPSLSKDRYHLGANILSPGLLRFQPARQIRQGDKQYCRMPLLLADPSVKVFISQLSPMIRLVRGCRSDKPWTASNCLGILSVLLIAVAASKGRGIFQSHCQCYGVIDKVREKQKIKKQSGCDVSSR
ncbi:hypothetical protein M752DRAFT_123458 [Aspergillus phoenicis ATCC 13157]|uniref:Uncharacterized protein n=1 Tax=Aspergillus phoenicis ATCC 13157 TaxID=1353007 RepID=A0A370PUG4_ASPPH|nr:hypothetical protein M752DRAFT_123458 [Aspergillus phoenicis ATCC 13157]